MCFFIQTIIFNQSSSLRLYEHQREVTEYCIATSCSIPKTFSFSTMCSSWGSLHIKFSSRNWICTSWVSRELWQLVFNAAIVFQKISCVDPYLYRFYMRYIKSAVFACGTCGKSRASLFNFSQLGVYLLMKEAKNWHTSSDFNCSRSGTAFIHNLCSSSFINRNGKIRISDNWIMEMVQMVMRCISNQSLK